MYETLTYLNLFIVIIVINKKLAFRKCLYESDFTHEPSLKAVVGLQEYLDICVCILAHP